MSSGLATGCPKQHGAGYLIVTEVLIKTTE